MNHVLYKTGDPDAPDSIKDAHGDVVLDQCRKCGRGEAELEQGCIAPMWCDDFDMDLLKVLPETPSLIQPARNVVLLVNAHTTHDTLNHPACFNTYEGLAAFFEVDTTNGMDLALMSATGGSVAPAGYYTRDPIVRCTAMEAFRDWWPHHYGMLVNRRHVIRDRSHWSHFERLMYHRRGWHKAKDEEVAESLDWLRGVLRDAAVLTSAIAVDVAHV